MHMCTSLLRRDWTGEWEGEGEGEGERYCEDEALSILCFSVCVHQVKDS